MISRPNKTLRRRYSIEFIYFFILLWYNQLWPNYFWNILCATDSFTVILYGAGVILLLMEIVETTGLYRSGHAVETMDASREAPLLLSEDIP